jgi:hypothetical protein
MNGFTEVSAMEMNEVDGGLPPLVVIGGIIVGAGATAAGAVAIHEFGKVVGSWVGAAINFVNGR